MRKCVLLLVVALSVVQAQPPRIPTGDERQEALDAHNRARADAASSLGIANLVALEWNDDAAEHGRSYLESHNCEDFAHSDSYAAGFGENLAVGQRSWEAAVYDGWYASEEACFLAGGFGCTDGHYTAVTWADTTSVGCAICEGDDAYLGVYYICNYSPGGNFIGRDPFVSGSTACSACPEDSPECATGDFAGLCVSADFGTIVDSGDDGDVDSGDADSEIDADADSDSGDSDGGDADGESDGGSDGSDGETAVDGSAAVDGGSAAGGSSGLAIGAQVGIGLVAALVVVGGLTLGYTMWWKKRNPAQQTFSAYPSTNNMA